MLALKQYINTLIELKIQQHLNCLEQLKKLRAFIRHSQIHINITKRIKIEDDNQYYTQDNSFLSIKLTASNRERSKNSS